MYINLLTAQHIPDEAVIKETDTGLLYFEGNSWKYLTKKEYKVLEDGAYGTKKIGKKTYADLPENEIVPAEKASTKSFRYYTNFFGLNELIVGDRKFYNTNGLVTEDIAVEKGKPVRLKADMRPQDFTSVEFSIIDGTEEVPILLSGEDKVVDEKVFFNCGTRMNGEDKIYRKDFRPLTREPDNGDFFSDSILTVSYTPDSRYHTYVPKHDTVKVKVVIRVYTEGAITPEISNLTLTQGG